MPSVLFVLLFKKSVHAYTERVCSMVKVAELVESKMELEKEAGCSQCKDNRLLVEKAWQVVASEYYDPQGKFSQAAWAKQLLRVFQVRTLKGNLTSVTIAPAQLHTYMPGKLYSGPHMSRCLLQAV